MTEEEFDRLLLDCAQELKHKQALLDEHYALSHLGRWQLDQEKGILAFFDTDGSHRVSFAVVPIGTFSTAMETWKWGWANSHLPQSLRAKAEPLKAIYERTDFDLFVNPEEFSVDEGMAWELAAIAVRHLGAIGCYRARNQQTYLFLALEEIVL